MVRNRILLFLLSLILVPTVSYFVILFARGYRFQPQEAKIVAPTGLLALSSSPDGAQVYISNTLKTATNTTLNLSPGEYEVEVKKEGFAPWKKVLKLEPEIVTQAWATLFPTVPSLRAITFSGSTNPVVSPDGSKISYVQIEKTASKIFTIDLSESPLGSLNRESRLITTLTGVDLTLTKFTWSPDSKQLLVHASPSAYLIELSNPVSIKSTTQPQLLIDSWQAQEKVKDNQKFSTLPPKLQELLLNSATDFSWSPKEDKLMYTATASATIADNLRRQLPGSSTQPQSRNIESGKVYVYDLTEDRNFLVGNTPKPLPTPSPNTKIKSTPIPKPLVSKFDIYYSWFPSSSHIVKTTTNKVVITDYDGTNAITVYEGPLATPLAAPYPSGKQLVILTNLTPSTSSLPNLYALSLK